MPDCTQPEGARLGYVALSQGLLDRQLFLIIPLALITALSFSGLARHALWNDEAFSFFVARGGLRSALDLIRFDTQPPLYYVLLSIWLKMGDSVVVQVAAVLRMQDHAGDGVQGHAGDGVVLSAEGSLRWGLAFYLRHDDAAGIAGLDPSELGQDRLIRSVEDAVQYRRVWVVVPKGEPPAVNLDALRQRAHNEWQTSVGEIGLYRFDL